ncbi:MAG: helix-turn-helix domain-containing protein [Pseudonocardiaceae bacterium]|nr:helix-turn-helix domain-containing protein [Pseudonocardiaceae bacterium]
MTEQHTVRTAFGHRLRVLRVDAGLSGKEFAERLGWAPSKVSKLEHGHQTATTSDVTVWTAALGAPQEVRDALLADLRSLQVEYATWRRQFRTGGFGRRQRAALPLESSSSLIRVFETDVVPGLLQTPQYARHLFTRLAEFRGLATDVEEAVRTRMHRQQLLYEPGRQFRFLLTETAMLSRVCPTTVLRAQLDRLLVLADLDTVDLALLPLDTPLPHPTWHGFWIYDDTLLLAETPTAELSLRDADDLATYQRLFESLWDVATHGSAALSALRRLIDRLG